MTTYRTDRTEPTEKLLPEKNSTLPHRPEINYLYAAYHAVCDESTIQIRRPLQILPERTTDAVLTKLPRPLSNDRKNI